MRYKAAGATDIGLVREENQDVILIDEARGLFIVADGMGGLYKGRAAAEFVVHRLSSEIQDLVNNPPGDLSGEISKSIRNVSKALATKSQSYSGSTVVLALLMKNHVIVANLGDSPAFLIDEHSCEKISVEHNLANDMVEMGKITAEEARTHPRRHLLTAYMGMNGNPPVSINKIRISPGKQLLLCSDGLSSKLDEDEILSIVGKGEDPQQTVTNLINAANAAGGEDNIAVILAQITD